MCNCTKNENCADRRKLSASYSTDVSAVGAWLHKYVSSAMQMSLMRNIDLLITSHTVASVPVLNLYKSVKVKNKFNL